MKSPIRSFATAAVVAAGMMVTVQSASALPAGGMHSATAAAPTATSHIEQIRYYGRGRGFGWGGVGAGLVAGALIGGALASPYYYNPYYARPYYPVAPAYAGPGDDAVAYCASRFRSYDPRTGTYMGYDGLRHPCP